MAVIDEARIKQAWFLSEFYCKIIQKQYGRKFSLYVIINEYLLSHRNNLFIGFI